MIRNIAIIYAYIEHTDKEKWVANLLTATHPSNSKNKNLKKLLRLW
jgi:hypothetical protein